MNSLFLTALLSLFAVVCQGCHNPGDGSLGERHLFGNSQYIQRDVAKLLEGHGLPSVLQSCVTSNIKTITERRKPATSYRTTRRHSYLDKDHDFLDIRTSCLEYREVCIYVLHCARWYGFDIPQLHFLVQPPTTTTPPPTTTTTTPPPTTTTTTTLPPTTTTTTTPPPTTTTTTTLPPTTTTTTTTTTPPPTTTTTLLPPTTTPLPATTLQTTSNSTTENPLGSWSESSRNGVSCLECSGLLCLLLPSDILCEIHELNVTITA